jgi:hypothetical protein
MTELQDARQRIDELEAQMERLKEKATAAGMLPWALAVTRPN